MKYKLLILFLTFLTFLSLQNSIHAQEVGFAIYPPIINIDANPPVILNQSIMVQNLSENEADVDIVIKPFKADPKHGGQLQYSLSDDFAGPDKLIKQKIKLYDGEQAITSLLLRPLEVKNLRLTIDLPEEQEKGDYYFSIIFLSDREGGSERSASQIPTGIGANVLLSIGPKGPTTGKIERFTTPFFISKGPVPFEVLIHNSSNHFINPESKIIISNMFGQKVGRVDLLPLSILSSSSRYLLSKEASQSAQNEIPNQFPETKAIWNEKLLFGFYTAELQIKLGENGPFLKKTVFFTALPLPLIFGLIFAFFIILGIYSRVRRKTRIH